MVRFEGATMTLDDEGNREYTPRGPIWINCHEIAAFYDHTILTGIHKIRVMESADEIQKKLRGVNPLV